MKDGIGRVTISSIKDQLRQHRLLHESVSFGDRAHSSHLKSLQIVGGDLLLSYICRVPPGKAIYQPA